MYLRPHRRGPLPWKFYLLLRLHHEHLRPLPGRRRVSSRIDATRLGLARSTLMRLRAFIAAHPKELESARRSGDWSPVEDLLFSNHPQFRSLPGYANALVLLGLADRVTPKPQHCRHRRRARRSNSRHPALSFWHRLWARLWGH